MLRTEIWTINRKGVRLSNKKIGDYLFLRVFPGCLWDGWHRVFEYGERKGVTGRKVVDTRRPFLPVFLPPRPVLTILWARPRPVDLPLTFHLTPPGVSLSGHRWTQNLIFDIINTTLNVNKVPFFVRSDVSCRTDPRLGIDFHKNRSDCMHPSHRGSSLDLYSYSINK